MSRWGPRATTTAPPPPVPPTTTANANANADGHNDDEHDFEVIDQVEWAPDDNNKNGNGNGSSYSHSFDDELAIKPRVAYDNDPCGCPRPPSGSTELACNDMSCVLYACQEECSRNCEAGDACCNKRIQRRQWKPLEVFDAHKKGKGLKVTQGCAKGDLVTEYVGRAINKAFLPRLFNRYQQERKLYIMALDKDICLDARAKGGLARYINHSCEPNCIVERWKVRGIIRAAVMALQDIPAGTELSFDYQWDRKRGRAPTKCHCGAKTCRGTLEVARSLEEEALERQLSAHWKKPLISRAGKEIVNRSIQVLSKETQEYYAADVTQYEEATGKHLLLYRQDLEEVWEDLKSVDWMILDEEAEQFIIGKKKAAPLRTSSLEQRSLLVMPEQTNNESSSNANAAAHVRLKNYMFVQTPIKDAFWNKHLIERCQRSCRVTITPKQMVKSPLPMDPDNEEDVELFKALERTLDGSVWKLTIVGSDMQKAFTILERNVSFLERKLAEANNTTDGGVSSSPYYHGDKTNNAESTTGVGTSTPGTPPTEVVLPRSIVDMVKKRLPLIRDKCRSVNIIFVPSESKSKQFAKLILEGTLLSDIEAAKEQLWMQLMAACVEVNAPLSPQGIYKDLGFLGGELSSQQFQRLLDYNQMESSSPSIIMSKSQDAQDDLARRSPFFASFESTQRCAIWVQSDSDKGRIDGSNRIVNEATPNAPRKIFFGCDPKEIPKLWALVQTRASEVARGVKYLYLGADRLYQPYMMRNGGQFLEYVRKVTGALVTVDSMTGDYLRIDGKSPTPTPETAAPMYPDNLSDGERAALAEELIRLQIELYRDHCIREQNWIFGRDWTLVRQGSTPKPKAIDSSISSNGSSPMPNRPTVPSPFTLYDARSISNGCLEIADIISTLNLGGSVAAHAVVILYRYLSIETQKGTTTTLMKIREVLLACIFLANKVQKLTKWRKLETVLEAAYNTFYPGAQFDRNKEEVLVLEEKVVSAEAEILAALDYDVFWRGFDWIVTAAKDAGKMDPEVAKDALVFSYSGPVLAAGADLWLKYGAEYVFAAAAGFLEANLETLCPALSLIPLKISQAAEMITESVKLSGYSKRNAEHTLFAKGKERLVELLPGINNICMKCMTMGLIGSSNGLNSSSASAIRYGFIGAGNRKRRIYRGVESSAVKEYVMSAVDGISAESKCSIFMEKNQQVGYANIILEGSWRAIAIAAYLLQESLRVHNVTIPPATDVATGQDAQSKVQSKGRPGLLQMKDVETADGWAGTVQSEVTNQALGNRKAGGKSCIAAKAKESTVREVGLRWWIPPRYGPSPTGSICDMFLVNSNGADPLGALADLTGAFVGESATFSMLASRAPKATDEASKVTDEASKAIDEVKATERYVAVSLQRWPSEKVVKKEKARGKGSEGDGTKVGFSAVALQEMQLLNQLHNLIRSPQGHPNFILPIGVALPLEIDDRDKPFSVGGTDPLDFSRGDDDIFSLTRSNEENDIIAQTERRRKDMVTGPHLVFQPTPFVLLRFMKKIRDSDGEGQSMSPAILSAWFHDLLSAVVHCHTNNVILRTMQADQIVVDHSGVAKLGCLYKATVVAVDEKPLDILEQARTKNPKGRKDKSADEDFSPLAAPEMLLGSPFQTKETDVWALGSLLAHLLLSKPMFSGKDRKSLLAAMYKVIGTPSSNNFPTGPRFPFYSKPVKKYAPGVVKALQTMMKREEESKKHAGAIDLLGQMLQLDPSKRISAVDALAHPYMTEYIENCATEPFRQQFVQDWMTLKTKLMKSGQTEEDEIKVRERGNKRKAMLMAASTNKAAGDDEDLYDMGELLSGGEKKPKI